MGEPSRGTFAPPHDYHDYHEYHDYNDNVRLCVLFICHTIATLKVPQCGQANWEKFYQTGQPVSFKRQDGGWTYCGQGPAVTTQAGGFGWDQSVPRATVSSSRRSSSRRSRISGSIRRRRIRRFLKGRRHKAEGRNKAGS